MPTFAKLFGAVGFAALFIGASFLMVPLFPFGLTPWYFTEFNAGIALILGWRIAGGRAGLGTMSGISNGITALVAIVFCTLALHGFTQMLLRSAELRYNGLMQAMMSGIGISFDLAVVLAKPTVIAVLLAGSIVIGIVTEFVAEKMDS